MRSRSTATPNSSSVRGTVIRIATLIAVLIGTVGLQAPAHAAGTTTSWSFTGSCCIYVPGGTGTNSWFTTTSEKDIYFRIDSFNPCSTGWGNVKITIELWRDDLGPDTKIGNDKEITCTGVAKWVAVNPNQYHFHMKIQYPFRDQYTYSATGRYAYNGGIL